MYHSRPARLTLSQEHIDFMCYKLRNANERYRRIAENIRSSKKSRRCSPYRIRAAWLGLRVDVGVAVALSDTQISKIPLPILDMTLHTPIEPKIVVRIPSSRPSQLPSITTTAPTPLGLTDVSRVHKIYSPIPPICIPARGPLMQLQGVNWGVPGAPLLRAKELPQMSPETYGNFSPMSLDSDSSGPHTPEDYYDLGACIRPVGKRKIRDIEVEDTHCHKYHLRKRWAQVTSTGGGSPTAVCQPRVYF